MRDTNKTLVRSGHHHRLRLGIMMLTDATAGTDLDNGRIIPSPRVQNASFYSSRALLVKYLPKRGWWSALHATRRTPESEFGIIIK